MKLTKRQKRVIFNDKFERLKNISHTMAVLSGKPYGNLEDWDRLFVGTGHEMILALKDLGFPIDVKPNEEVIRHGNSPRTAKN